MSHEHNRKLIEVLANCAAECNHCATACLEEKDVSMLTRCIKLDLDCGEICALAISFVSRGSEHAEHVCMNVPRYVKPVLRSVKSILVWSIVKDAQTYAGPAQKLVIQEWQLNAVITKIQV